MNCPRLLTAAALAGLVLIAGCDGGGGVRGGLQDDASRPPVPMRHYAVTVVNLSSNQPLSPLAVIAHGDGFTGWTIGAPASIGLERLAEGGETDEFLEASGGTVVISGSGIIAPGASETVEFDVPVNTVSDLTVATMLVNTNDAFTGVAGSDIAGFSVGETRSFDLAAYDAGTEANLELAGTIPGPADGGVGFDESRDDSDTVARHPGIVGSDDGNPDSVLDASHRFDNPVARLEVIRLE